MNSLSLLQTTNETKGLYMDRSPATTSGLPRKVVAFVERIECLRERERKKERCGDSGANSRPFERMTINEATV